MWGEVVLIFPADRDAYEFEGTREEAEATILKETPRNMVTVPHLNVDFTCIFLTCLDVDPLEGENAIRILRAIHRWALK